MNSIFITGSTGFVGTNLIKYLKSDFTFFQFKKNESIIINEDIVIHLAGKAHDLKNISNHQEYYQVNTELTKKVFDAFLVSEAKVFITLSSVKAVADKIVGELIEADSPNPITHYGKSKLLGEEYILSKQMPDSKRVYILRPCMIYGSGNKGNLNLLYKLVSKGIPWPLGAFENKRSFCSIDNLIFIINELIKKADIPSGIYNVSDDEPLSTNEVISLIGKSLDRKTKIWKLPRHFVLFLAKLGDLFYLPLNSERLEKLTESFVVSNNKIKSAIGKPLPVSSKDGLMQTFKSFK
jgi:nucleoside-diphosphate-sugar epimerase